ncbi:MAG TPA: Spy/CpxP family protein refolding chaperone [Holophagaceae bacterium]|nr:Spy/CpxP family protein refolding chaperone [Holophagaceae bacterium]
MPALLRSALILLLAAGSLAAQPGQPQGPRAERLVRALNLTEAQKTAIQGIRDKHQPEMAQRRAAARQAQEALRAALRDAAISEAQLRALHDKASAARFDMMLARRSVHQEVQAVLTPEQREKAAELRGMARERMRGHRGQGRGSLGMMG